MKSTLTIVAPVLASAALLGASAAAAQYGPQPAPQQTQAQPVPAAQPERKLNVSRKAAKALTELQEAVNANDVANIPAKLAAARVAAQSADEKYFVAQMQLKAATAANDQVAAAAALEALLASGGVEPAQVPVVHFEHGNLLYRAKQYPQAAASFERVLAAQPNHSEALILLAETRHSQGQTSAAVGLLQRALQARLAAGSKAPEEWYKRAVGLAYEAQMPVAVELGRQWVAAYPSPLSWRDSLRIFRKIAKPDEEATLDTLRLARATGALDGDADFHVYAFTASNGAAVGEARAVVDEAIAAKKIDPNKPLFKDIIATLKANRSMTREALPELAKNAQAGTAARLAVRTADAYYGYGDYAQAAELYRAALTKSGADANRVNLHLGMSLARAGDKAGATAALNAVSGPLSELAKFWLVYVGTRT